MTESQSSTTSQNQILLTDIIAPSFYPVHWDILEGKHTYYDLYGGRGSTKSSFISVEIVLGMMQDEQANAIIFRKYATTLRESVFEQIQWSIDVLGASEQWIERKSPLSFIYKPTGQKIIFRGLDKAKKTKSIKVSHGYFKFLWFEELDEFAGIEEIRTVQQSVLRGGQKFVVFKSFNPPITNANWANQYVNEPREDSLRHKSDYTTVPPEWLGQQFIDDAEHLKATNEKAYNHEYLGIPVGLGTTVFEFIEIRRITDEEIANMERIYQGQDWGWYPDPKAFVRLGYNRNKETLYYIDEMGGCKIRVADMAEQIKKKHYDDYQITCGADEQESIVDYRSKGLPARAAEVGRMSQWGGSVKYTMEWMQCRKHVIDPQRTPNLYREFINYELEVDANGEVIAAYPDRDNHWIDATRYAISPMALRRGNSA